MFLLVALPLLIPLLAAQNPREEYRVYTEHPRLFLRPQRLRLLKRERERQSMRWRQFESLVSGNAAFAEPGFALGLYYAVSGEARAGRRAVEWALGPSTDLRQLALVYDWCQDLLSETQAKALAAKVNKGLQTPATSLVAERNRVLGAIAIAEQDQNTAEALLRDAHLNWWRANTAPRLEGGANLDPGAEAQALFEILHAYRDNLIIDLRSDAPDYFKALAGYQVICNYPAPYPAAENEYRIPVFKGSGEPDLTRAALARAAGLGIVAYDTNALESQFLQGYLIQDRFMLRGAFGAPYEFLWANPYQPGLSYAHLPVTFHDDRSGALFLRSNWDEDAVWFALYRGEAQIFRDGHVTVLTIGGSRGGESEALHVGDSDVLLFRGHLRFRADAPLVFVVGGGPRTTYNVEVDDEELAEYPADVAGTLELKLSPGLGQGVRIEEASHGS